MPMVNCSVEGDETHGDGKAKMFQKNVPYRKRGRSVLFDNRWKGSKLKYFNVLHVLYTKLSG